MISWVFWVAVAGLVGAIGKFLDDYHLRKSHKANVRDFLVSLYFKLDATKIPDAALAITQKTLQYGRKHNLKFFLIILTYSVFMSVAHTAFLCWFTGSSFFSPGPLEFLQRCIESTLTTSLIITMCIEGIIKIDQSQFFPMIFMLAIVSSVGFFLLWYTTTSRDIFMALLFITAANLTSLPILVLFVLGVLRGAVRGVQIVAMATLDSASSPDKSPFTYAAALIGIMVLFGKVIESVFSGA